MTTYTNIARILHSATDADVAAGMSWYGEANALAESLSPGDVMRGAGVIAAFSPLTPWWRNVELATTSCQTGIARTDTLGNSSRAAQRILDGEYALDVLKGKKTNSFARNIALNGNTDDVTVDVHAYSIAMGERIPSSQIKGLGVKVYRQIADAYRAVAMDAEIAGNQCQAITWVAWRRMHGVNPKPAEVAEAMVKTETLANSL